MPDKLIEKEWVDIVLPPPPDTNMLLWWLLVLIVVLCIAIALVIWYRRPRQQLRRMVQKLTRQSSATHDYKQLLARLEQGLCQYYHLPHLSAAVELPVDCQIFFKQITQYRYQCQQPSLVETHALLQQALTLLTRSGKQHVG